MRMLGRTALVLGLACLAQASSLHAQSSGFDTYRWYIGGQAGVTILETQTQTAGAIFTGGAHLLVTAKRTGLLLSVDEGFARDQATSYPDPTVLGGSRQVLFNDVRKYTVAMLAFPFKSVAQPYFGLGIGYLHTVTEKPQGTFGSPSAADTAATLADRLGGYGFGTAIGGVQLKVNRFMLFGQYQITSGPAKGKLIVGVTHTFLGGIRIGLGSAREGVDDRGGT
jgi:hypothetical protein